MSNILLVDDDEDLVEMLKDVLEMHGYRTVVAFSGKSALLRMQASTFDLILLDWQLPDMTGIEVCKQYRSDGGSAPVLMLTGMRDASSKDSLMQAGANMVLAKPFSLDQFLPAVANMLPITAD